ncbi:hypothetical protein ACH8E3_09645 [Paenibacillus sp. CMAA1364]
MKGSKVLVYQGLIFKCISSSMIVGLLFTALTITIVSVVLLYLLLQRYIVEGMTAGSVKG